MSGSAEARTARMPPAARRWITSRHRTAVIFESSPSSLPLSPMLTPLILMSSASIFVSSAEILVSMASNFASMASNLVAPGWTRATS